MAKNEFLPFGTAEGANVLSNQEYEVLAARHNGFNSGVAKSKELNKVWRQASLISSAVAQFIVDTDQKDLHDTGDVADIKSRLASAINLIISNGDYVTNPYLKLELLKKIDKADITQQLGNDTGKVASQNLLTTELGKKASVADANSKLAKDQNGADIPDKPKFIENLGLRDELDRKLDKQSGGKILAPVSVSGRRANDGILVVDTMTDGNNVGDGQTQFGYNTGTEDKPVFNHYLRGAGSVFVDTLNGLSAIGDIKSQKSIIPKDYANFDNRFLQLSQLGDREGQVPDMSLFAASLGFQGWQSLPSLDSVGNLIIQWGSFGQFKAGEGVTVTFRKPFPSHCVFAIAITVRPSTSTTTQEAAYLAEKSATSARFTKGGTETSDGVWLALGY